MLKERLNKGKSFLPKEKHKLLTPKKLVPRHEELRKLEGWRTVEIPEEERIAAFIASGLDKYIIDTGGYSNTYALGEYSFSTRLKIKQLFKSWCAIEVNRQRFTKYLKRKLEEEYEKVDIDFAKMFSDMGKVPPTFSFKLSCSFNDILRVESPHYKSCYFRDGDNLGCNAHAPFNFCFDCTLGVIYIPDKAGDYLFRAYVHICKDEKGNKVLYIPGCYGETSYLDGIVRTLEKELPVCLSLKAACALPACKGINPITGNLDSSFFTYIRPLVRSGLDRVGEYYEDNKMDEGRYKTLSLETINQHL